jgi:[ribosomal protein S5]-alanine N-acetyltransferase
LYPTGDGLEHRRRGRQRHMTTVIETPRLLLRELADDDLDALAAIFADPEVMRFIGTGGVRNRVVARLTIERQQTTYRERGFGEWATVERSTGDMVGLCGLIHWDDIDGVDELEVAYLLARSAWGRGLGTEVAGAIRDHAHSTLQRRRLVSCIYPDNAASIRVATKIGMHHEKDFRYEGSVMSLFSCEGDGDRRYASTASTR